MLTRSFKGETRQTIGFSSWPDEAQRFKVPENCPSPSSERDKERHTCTLLVCPLTSSGNTGISRALFCASTGARARTHTRREDSELVSTTTGVNLSAPPLLPRPLPLTRCEPTHTFMPLHPTVPHPSPRSP